MTTLAVRFPALPVIGHETGLALTEVANGYFGALGASLWYQVRHG